MTNFPKMKSKGREDTQVSPSGSDGNDPRQNWCYALQVTGEQESPADVTVE